MPWCTVSSLKRTIYAVYMCLKELCLLDCTAHIKQWVSPVLDRAVWNGIWCLFMELSFALNFVLFYSEHTHTHHQIDTLLLLTLCVWVLLSLLLTSLRLWCCWGQWDVLSGHVQEYMSQFMVITLESLSAPLAKPLVRTITCTGIHEPDFMVITLES